MGIRVCDRSNHARMANVFTFARSLANSTHLIYNHGNNIAVRVIYGQKLLYDLRQYFIRWH